MVKPEHADFLKHQIALARAASDVLQDSVGRAEKIMATPNSTLSIEQMETLEALTSRFSRLSDLLFQRVFRTLDQIELIDEGSHLDRLNRCEKRAVITSAALWRQIREIRNAIAHDYLIEQMDTVVADALKHSAELFLTVERIEAYVLRRAYLSG